MLDETFGIKFEDSFLPLLWTAPEPMKYILSFLLKVKSLNSIGMFMKFDENKRSPLSKWSKFEKLENLFMYFTRSVPAIYMKFIAKQT